MLYTSIVDLSFFDTFRTENINDLIEDLELENNDTKLNLDVSLVESNRVKIPNDTFEDSFSENNKCRC